MRPRFQADADFNQKIVLGLRRRERAVDFGMPTRQGLSVYQIPMSSTKRPISGGF